MAPAVRPYRDGDQGAWNAFVLAHPEGTFFHLAEWREVLRRAFGHATHYLLAERDGRICGVLPLAEVRSLLFGHALVSTPFCVYGGIVAADPRAHDALTAGACELARALGVGHLEMRNRRREHPDWPAKDLYVTFRKSDRPRRGREHAGHSAQAARDGAQGHQGGAARRSCIATPSRHYATYSESLRNLGTPVFSRRYPELLLETFGDDCEILTVMHGDRPVASCMSFYFRDEVLPYYGGGTRAARELGGNDFMYWSVMERARQRGCRVFDYGRSKRGTGSYDFKRYWGFEPEPLYYEYFLVNATAVPDLSPVNPRYERVIAAWRRLPLWLTRLLGPPLAKYLG